MGVSHACTVCSHEQRAQIELGLVYRVPGRVLARRFDVSRDALWRHKKNHLSPQQSAALLAARKPSAIDLEALERDESEGLLAQLITQRARLQTFVEMALGQNDVRAALAVERGVTANLELTAKLLGQLVTRHEVRSTSILVSPDYLQLRSILVKTLQPHPEAARAVGAALHAMETRAAQEIAAAGDKRPLLLDGHREALEGVAC